MAGQTLTFSGNGDTYSGYLARSRDGSGPGVIVFQEWWGLVPHIEDICDRLAVEGFTALAPDLYHGQRAEDPDTAGRLMMALNIAATEKITHGAIDALLADSATTGDKAGVIGFCMGGQLALYAACVNPKIGACVDFYGIHPNVELPLENLESPVLGLFAEFDEYASPNAVAALEARLNNLGKEHEFHTYPGAHHAFFNDTRQEVHDGNASKDAWERTLGFLRKHLRRSAE